jgi:hypothetical protein
MEGASNVAIIRKAKPNRFCSISNQLLQDSSISFECRGLIAYLLSKPDNWKCRVSDIEREGNIGRTERRRIMLEAERAGYLTYLKQRGVRGKFDDTYMVHEEPVPKAERTNSASRKDNPPYAENPHPVKPHTDEPHPDEPHTENPTTYKETEVPNTDLTNTENNLFGSTAATSQEDKKKGKTEAPKEITVKIYTICKLVVADCPVSVRKHVSNTAVWLVKKYPGQSLETLCEALDEFATWFTTVHWKGRWPQPQVIPTLWQQSLDYAVAKAQS